jgi:putative lipoprotein
MERVGGSRIITGEIELPSGNLPSEAKQLVVQIEDVSRADAPSQVIAESRHSGIPLMPGASIPFKIEVPADKLDEEHSYSIRAHVDVSGSGRVDSGDLVSTQSYPVLTRGYGESARVKVKIV